MAVVTPLLALPSLPHQVDDLIPRAVAERGDQTTKRPMRKEQSEPPADLALPEGDMISRANKNKRNKLRCKTCSTVGILMRNGGADKARRARKCKVCNKQILGKTLPLLLEDQLERN